MMTRTSSFDNLVDLTELARGIDRMVRDAASNATPIHEVEKHLLEQVLRLGREALGKFLALQGTGDQGESVTLPTGQEVRRLVDLHGRTYRSVFGTFELQRTVYGSREKQRIEVVPLDQRLALPESDYSYLLQDWSQMLGMETAFAKVREFLGRFVKVQIPVDSIERMNRQMASSVQEFRETRPAPSPDQEGRILVLTGDNKGIPMRRPRDQVPAGRPRRKGEKANKKKMATVGCVYTVDPKHRTAQDVVAALFRERRDRSDKGDHEPKAKQKRIWSSLSLEGSRGQDEVFAWMAEEAQGRLGSVQDVVCLMDGQDSLWNDREQYLNLEEQVQILDLLHATARVWQAAHLFHREGSEEAVAFAKTRILSILEGKVGYVIGGLRQMATKQGLKGKKLKTLRTICGYFHNNKDRMRYDVYLARGYPIASGVIEGACRYVVKDRMERAGMRWTVEGAQAILDLRTTYVNDQWEEFQSWRTEQETQRQYPYRLQFVSEHEPLPMAA